MGVRKEGSGRERRGSDERFFEVEERTDDETEGRARGRIINTLLSLLCLHSQSGSEEDRAGEMLALEMNLGGDVEVSDPMVYLLVQREPAALALDDEACSHSSHLRLLLPLLVGKRGWDRASFVSQTDEDLEPLWILC
jgi:hypothetical protein